MGLLITTLRQVVGILNALWYTYSNCIFLITSVIGELHEL